MSQSFTAIAWRTLVAASLLLPLPAASVIAQPTPSTPKLIQLHAPGSKTLQYHGTRVRLDWSMFFASGFGGWIVGSFSPDSGRTWTAFDSVRYSTPRDSMYWIVPVIETDHGWLRVATDDGEAVSMARDLVLRPQPFVRLTWPNGGERLTIGTMLMITWKTRSVTGHFTLEYQVEPDGYWYSIIGRHDARDADDSLAWEVPPMPTTQARVRILHEESSIADTSDAVFSIGGATGVHDEAVPDRMDLSDLLRHAPSVPSAASIARRMARRARSPAMTTSP